MISMKSGYVVPSSGVKVEEIFEGNNNNNNKTLSWHFMYKKLNQMQSCNKCYIYKA